MPEGPLGAPRLTDTGPLSRPTAEEISENWQPCPRSGEESTICKTIKKASIEVLESQGALAKYKSLEDINSGKCHDIARAVAQLHCSDIDFKVLEVADRDHAWIKYKGKHYDAEVPTGVSQYEDLPFFYRATEILLHTYERSFNTQSLPYDEIGIELPYPRNVDSVDQIIFDVTEMYCD